MVGYIHLTGTPAFTDRECIFICARNGAKYTQTSPSQHTLFADEGSSLLCPRPSLRHEERVHNIANLRKSLMTRGGGFQIIAPWDANDVW